MACRTIISVCSSASVRGTCTSPPRKWYKTPGAAYTVEDVLQLGEKQDAEDAQQEDQHSAVSTGRLLR